LGRRIRTSARAQKHLGGAWCQALRSELDGRSPFGGDPGLAEIAWETDEEVKFVALSRCAAAPIRVSVDALDGHT
jgi:hypothetical protein